MSGLTNCEFISLQTYGIAGFNEGRILLASLTDREPEVERGGVMKEYNSASFSRLLNREREEEGKGVGVRGRKEGESEQQEKSVKGDTSAEVGEENPEGETQSHSGGTNMSHSSSALKPLPHSPAPPSTSDAVLILQAGLRGYLCRRNLKVCLTKHRAATTIQATW